MPSAIEQLEREFPVVISLPVQWGEQDAFGHVNNIIYFRWCESARISYIEQIGLWETFLTSKVGPILAAINLNYRKPVNYPDTVYIGARVPRIGNSSFTMEHRVVSKALDMTVAEGDSVIVVFDYNVNKPAAIPDATRRAMEKLENGCSS